VSTHKVVICNSVYPWFRSTAAKYRDFPARAGHIADLVNQSGADCATFGEMGYEECRELARHLPDFQYDRAQGHGSGHWIQGINSVWSKTAVWNQPESDLGDWVLPSGDQTPPRTLIIAKLTEKKDPTAFVSLGAFHETLGNDLGMQYVQAMIQKVGNKRILLGGDFKRTGDSDDIAAMKKAGFTFHERVSATPMTCITKNAVTVTAVDHRNDARAFDHPFLVVDFSIPTGVKP
jgi:hypothetical protein